MDKTKILILCIGNSTRSQIAESYFKKFAGDRIQPYSAGLTPSKIHPLTRKVLAEDGIDMVGQYSKSVKEFLGKVHFQYVFTVCDLAHQQCPTIFLNAKMIHWDIEDPSTCGDLEEICIQKFREVRDTIKFHVKEWLTREN